MDLDLSIIMFQKLERKFYYINLTVSLNFIT